MIRTMTVGTNNEKVRNWRTLKQIYRHYLMNSEGRDGKSAADVIKACFAQRAFEERTFQRFGTARHAELVYNDSVKSLDAVLKKTEADLHRLMMQEAQNGAWIAHGRRNPDSDHEPIPFRYWAFLTLDIENNAVRGDGLSFRDLRCLLSKDIAEDDPIRAVVERAQSPPTLQRHGNPLIVAAAPDGIDAPEVASSPMVPPAREDLSRNGAPGRPSFTHLIDSEFERRKKIDAIEASRTQEAAALLAWFKAKYPDLRPPGTKTITNRLSKIHKWQQARPPARNK